MKTKYLLTLLIMLLAFSTTFSATYHSGVISSNTDWRTNGNPHIISGTLWISNCKLIIRQGVNVEVHANVYVDGKGTLEIEKDVDVEISGIIDLFTGYNSYFFDIQGTLDAQGTSTAGEEIIFHEDDYYDGYGWEGIRFSDSAKNCIIKYCVLKEAKKDNSTNNSVNSTYAGGAIYINGNLNVDIENCEFDDNESSWGGAICCINGGDNIVIKNNEFHDNTASSGGAVYFYNTDDTRISLNKFYDNSADNYGGAVFLDNFSDNVEFYNNLLNNNTASYGGGLAIDDSDPEIYNNTIADNEATTNGSGCYYDENNSNPDFRNTIIYLNTNDQVYPDPDNNTGDYEYCCIENINFSTNSNINGDPQFIDESDGHPYKISKDNNSSCIDAGTNGTSSERETVDLKGHTRLTQVTDNYARIDIGAYEYENPGQSYKIALKQELSTESTENSIDMLIYPNPAKSQFSIKITAEEDCTADIIVTDFLGKSILSNKNSEIKSGNNIFKNEVSFPEGIYFVTIQKGKEKIVKKLVVN